MFEERAIFPLHTVLFPGTQLPLRIFEQRYLRMVSECMKKDDVFVISLIQGEGREVGEAGVCFPVGTLAKIIDFNQGKDKGILDIVVQGLDRVSIVNGRHEFDKLMRAKTENISEQIVVEVAAEFSLLRKLFDHVVQQNPALNPEFSFSGEKLSATQLSFYLSHLAPVSIRKKQRLLELTSTEDRLHMLGKIFSEITYTMTA